MTVSATARRREESDGSPAVNAAREFAEETLGIYGGGGSASLLLTSPLRPY